MTYSDNDYFHYDCPNCGRMLFGARKIRTVRTKCQKCGLTDMGNAERLCDAYGSEIKYCNAAKCWYRYDGKVWVKDEHGIVRHPTVKGSCPPMQKRNTE